MLKDAIKTSTPLASISLLLNPTFWLAICIWTAMTAIYCVDVGAERERLKQNELTARALEKQSEAHERVLKAERQLRTDNLKAFDTYRQEQLHADQARDQLLTDLRRDNRRLRIPTSSVCRTAPPGGGEAPAGDLPQGYAELDERTAGALIDIASRGDEGIRKHAAVVDAYERLRLACTATDQPAPAPVP